MVVVRADHDVFFAQRRIGALDDAHDILRTDVALVVGDGKVLAQGVGEHQHAGVFQGLIDIARGQALPLAARQAAVQLLVAEGLDMLPQGRGNSKILCGEARRTEFQHQKYE